MLVPLYGFRGQVKYGEHGQGQNPIDGIDSDSSFQNKGFQTRGSSEIVPMNVIHDKTAQNKKNIHATVPKREKIPESRGSPQL
jgi:hypothetical protein